MIGGASQADLAVLVISARKGEFETGFERGGQTREHAMLVKTAGVKHMVVLINKMDDPTVKWDLERYENFSLSLLLIITQLKECFYNAIFSPIKNLFPYFRYNYCKDSLIPYLKKVGFNPAKDLKFIPCSGLTGAGLKEPVGSVAPWYT